MTKEETPIAVEFNKENRQVEQDQGLNSTDQTPTSNIQTNFANKLPASLNLDVPFTSQAPLGNWNETFKEGCEEASIMMIDRFYNQQSFTSPETTENEILKMVAWQKNYFGGHYDLTISQTAEMIKNYLGYNKAEVIDNPTVEQIKEHLNQQHPVIVPAAGQELGNPNFRRPGPIYHMLVIKGYTADKFITNDPGTRHGADYVYAYQTVMAAMHDWNNGDDIRQGAPRIIVIYPN